MLESRAVALEPHAFISLVPVRHIFSVAVFKGRLAALQAALGVTLPYTPRRVEGAGGTILWSGPGNWLVLTGNELPDEVKHHAAVTAQTDGRSIFRLHLPQARAALAKLVPVDLHDSVFAPDSTAQTLAGHINVQIWREGEAFHLACHRSFAESLFHDFVIACRAFEDSD